MLKGNWHTKIMSAYLQDIAHSFVLQNVKLMETWYT
jgi:hypothetical protein